MNHKLKVYATPIAIATPSTATEEEEEEEHSQCRSRIRRGRSVVVYVSGVIKELEGHDDEGILHTRRDFVSIPRVTETHTGSGGGGGTDA